MGDTGRRGRRDEGLASRRFLIVAALPPSYDKRKLSGQPEIWEVAVGRRTLVADFSLYFLSHRRISFTALERTPDRLRVGSAPCSEIAPTRDRKSLRRSRQASDWPPCR